jgi:hypothetical protein
MVLAAPYYQQTQLTAVKSTRIAAGKNGAGRTETERTSVVTATIARPVTLPFLTL